MPDLQMTYVAGALWTSSRQKSMYVRGIVHPLHRDILRAYFCLGGCKARGTGRCTNVARLGGAARKDDRKLCAAFLTVNQAVLGVRTLAKN